MTDTETKRPDFVMDVHLRFLDELRRGGSINMFESPRALQEMFEMPRRKAIATFQYWAATFESRNR